MTHAAVSFRQWLGRWGEAWDQFWFTPADPATLAVLRITGGGMLLYTHLVWSRDLLGFFGPSGRLPSEWVQSFHGSPFAWSHLYYLESPTLLWLAHAAALLVLLLLVLGLWSRVTSILSALVVIAYAHRGAGALFGLDQINGLIALYLAVGGGGGQAYSLDRLLAKRRGGRPPEIEWSTQANLGIRLTQVHMCVVYLFAGGGKLLGDTWWDGTAIWHSFANYEYQSLDMTWLAAWPAVINALTLTSVAWELSYPFLVWNQRLRPIVVGLAVPLHLGIALCMGMMTFGLVMILGNLAFVPPSWVRACVNRFPSFGRSSGSTAPIPAEAAPAGRRRRSR